MKYVVEARIYDNGKVIPKLYKTDTPPANGCTELEKCDVWIDIFNSEEEAQNFLNGYFKA